MPAFVVLDADHRHYVRGQALPLTIKDEDLKRGCVYPSLYDIRRAMCWGFRVHRPRSALAPACPAASLAHAGTCLHALDCAAFAAAQHGVRQRTLACPLLHMPATQRLCCVYARQRRCMPSYVVCRRARQGHQPKAGARGAEACLAMWDVGACLTPTLNLNLNRRDISRKLAREVLKQAAKEGHLGNLEAERQMKKGNAALEDWIAEHQYVPGYRPLIHLPEGVLE